MTQDDTSVEAKILTLDAKSLMVLSMLPVTKTDAEIIRWSGLWKYTQKDIEHAIGRVCDLFGYHDLGTHSERRVTAAHIYNEYTRLRSAGMFPEPCQSVQKNEEEVMVLETQVSVPTEALPIDMTSPVAVRLGKLNPKLFAFAGCLVLGMSPEEIAQKLNLQLSTVTQYKTALFANLQLPKSLGIKNRLEILKQSWELYHRTKQPPIAESSWKPPPTMSEVVETVLPPEPSASDAGESQKLEVADTPKAPLPTAPVSDVEIGSTLPALGFDDPSSVIGVKLIPATGQIPDSVLTEGYRCEALLASRGKNPHMAAAFLVMVLRK